MFHRLLYNDFLAALYVDCSGVRIVDFAARKVVKRAGSIVVVIHGGYNARIITKVICQYPIVGVEVYLAFEKN